MCLVFPFGILFPAVSEGRCFWCRRRENHLKQMVSYIKLNLRTISLKSESLLSRGRRSRLGYTGASFSRLSYFWIQQQLVNILFVKLSKFYRPLKSVLKNYWESSGLSLRNMFTKSTRKKELKNHKFKQHDSVLKESESLRKLGLSKFVKKKFK